jgi:hypothetical protein
MSEEDRLPLRFFDAASKVGQTVRLMAVLPDRLQSRIVAAFISQWSRTKAEDYPRGELREDFERINRRLTAGPMTDEVARARGGLIHATILSMSDDEARDLAESICTFEYNVSRAVERYRYDHDLRARLDEEILNIIDATEPVN